ncbi:MAG: type III pantothenate kinase [Candidatus Avispirillum sp.]
MLLAADIGNTSIKFALFDSDCEKLIYRFSVSSRTERTSCEYVLLIESFLNSFFSKSTTNFSAAELNSSVISSVVPHITETVSEALQKICKKPPFIIGAGTRTGFPIRIDVQSQLGADIVSNACAAFQMCEPPFAVVDMGTATTVTCVDCDGALVGTVIAPGADVSLKALLDSAALLTDVPLSCPEKLIGKNSYDSIRSGAFFGTVYAIDGFIRNIRETLCKNGEKLSLIGTGGSSGLLEHCRNKFTLIPDLTLKGAAALYYSNCGK